MLKQRFSFVFVNYFSRDLIVDNLHRIEKIVMQYPDFYFDCVVVNNSFEELHIPFEHFSFEVNILTPEENLGYAKGNNLGIKKAIDGGASQIIICNPDIIISCSFFRCLLQDVDVYEKLGLYHSAAAFAVRIKGLKPYYNTPSFWGLIIPALTRYKDFKVVRDTEYKSVYRFHGACFVIPVDNVKEFLEYFYPETFLYMEEDLFSYKASQANLRIFNLPSTVVTHIGGVTTNQSIPWKKYVYYFDGLNLLFNKKYRINKYVCYPISFVSVCFRFLLEQRSRLK